MKQYVWLWFLSWSLLGCQHAPSAQSDVVLSDRALAQIAFNSGDWNSAVNLYRQALNDVKPAIDKSDIYFELARAYRRLGQPKTALTFIAKMSQQTGLSYQLQGQCQLDNQEFYEAEQAFRQALLLDEQAPVSVNGLAVALSWQGQFERSEAVFIQLNKLEPERLEYLSNRSLNLIMLAKYQQIISLLMPVYQRGDSQSHTRLYLGLALIRTSQLSQAKAVLARDYSGDKLTAILNYLQHLSPTKQPLMGQ